MKQIEKYKGLLDMIDGGGAGKVGDKFQGGGLLSILANALATPYGSEDRAKEELAAGLLGKTRPVMRPNRPAPSAPPTQGMSLNSGPAMPRMPNGPQLAFPGNPNGPIDDGLGPMPQRLPGDPGLGFNPANAAPVQVDSGQQLSPLEMFGAQQPADYSRPVQGSGMTPANNYVAPPAPPSQAVQHNDFPTIHQYATSVGYPDNGMSQDQLIKSYVDSLGG